MPENSSHYLDGMAQRIEALRNDKDLRLITLDWVARAGGRGYGYNFSWLGRPIIQVPQDIMAMQELIWQVKPDLVIETGIAHGGSLIMSASMLAMLDYCEAVGSGTVLDPADTRRRVMGVDIDISSRNREAIETHPMAHRIDMLQGSSVDPGIIAQVHEKAERHERIMVCLDSDHTHDHVLAELEAYAGLTSKGSYCVVFDTSIEDMPEEIYTDRSWGKGNNPKTAVWEFLGKDDRFVVDKEIQEKLLITASLDGYLKRVKD